MQGDSLNLQMRGGKKVSGVLDAPLADIFGYGFSRFLMKYG